MKKLIVIFFLIGISAQAQVWDKHFYVPSINTQFGQPVGAYKLVACAEDSTWYILTARREKTDSLATAVRLGEYKIFYGGSPWYHASGATWQKYTNDSLSPNSKIAFRLPIGYLNARSATFPATNYANIYLNGNAGSAQVYAGYNGSGGFDNSTINQTLAPSVGAVSWLFSSGVGTYKYHMDKSGLYPTIYTSGDYQHLGTTLYPWNATYTKRVNLPATDTTGVGSTANVGTMMYYNGHFYGLKAGLPPTWVQLDN